SWSQRLGLTIIATHDTSLGLLTRDTKRLWQAACPRPAHGLRRFARNLGVCGACVRPAAKVRHRRVPKFDCTDDSCNLGEVGSWEGEEINEGPAKAGPYVYEDPPYERVLLRHGEAADDGVRVVGEADAVNAVRGLQFAGADGGGLVVAADDRAVDRALDLVALDRQRDLLRDRLARACGLVHGAIRLT